MNIYGYTIKSEKQDNLFTEIVYNIASAKALQYEIVQFTFKSDSMIAKIARIMKKAKQDGIIDLYVLSSEPEKFNTEIEYLVNKFPELNDVLNRNNDLYCILKIKNNK